MSNRLDGLTDKIGPLIRMLASESDGEVINAARALRRILFSSGLDFHALAERVEHDGEAPLGAGEMQKLYDAGCEKGFGDGSEYGRHSAILAAQPIGIFASPVDNGVNGYSWQQIAAHRALNRHLFSGKALEFVESIPEKLDRYGGPTPKQAEFLRDLLVRRFGGRIE